ncbi:22441_t:CDS:2, partial [Cetraspora pellucida]
GPRYQDARTEVKNTITIWCSEVIEVNTCNEEVFETSICNKNNIQTTTHDKEVSKTSTSNKNNMETTTQNEPRNKQENSTLERNTTFSSKKSANIRLEQEPHAGSSANKKENPYLQDDASITDDKDLSPDSISTPCDELAALYLNAEPQAENKNTEETLPIIE